MCSLKPVFDNITKMLDSSITVLRESSGENAQAGHDDVSCSHDQTATLLEGAVLLIGEAAKRLQTVE